MDTAKLVTFGLGGDTVYVGAGATIQGYGSPENPHAAAPHSDRTIPDGTPAIDKREAVETPEGYAWVFKGPLPGPDLPAGHVHRVMAPWGSSEPLNGTRAGALDEVAIDLYVEGWRAHGARIGRYVAGAIEWEG